MSGADWFAFLGVTTMAVALVLLLWKMTHPN
jgi:hypothetical protein